MTKIVAGMLMGALLLPSLSWAKTPQEKVQALPAGKSIEVRLRNQEVFRGLLGQVGAEEFEVATVQNGQAVSRKIAFSEVESVKRVSHKKRTATYITVAAVGGAAVFLGVGYWAVTHGHWW